MRDSFIFYRSFFEAAETLKTKDKLKLFESICDYALNDAEISLDGAAEGMFKLLKPQIDANTRKYENGKKGGRPKKNQDETKTKPKRNQSESKPKRNDNVNVNVNVNDNDNDNAVGCGSGADSDDPFNIYQQMTPEDIDAVYDVYPESGGDLIEEVYHMCKQKRRVVNNPLPYILGYAKNVGWDDKAEHFEEVAP